MVFSLQWTQGRITTDNKKKTFNTICSSEEKGTDPVRKWVFCLLSIEANITINNMGGRTISVSGFPLTATAAEIKSFLEGYTGQGTVYALKIRKPKVIKPKSFAFAVVQFTQSSYASDIRRRIEARLLYYGRSYLKVRDVERDIVPKPRVHMFDMLQTTLHLGCQVSEDKMSVLCSVSNVEVQFGVNLRKISYFLSWDDRSYKLELSYDSIWEIKLHRSSLQQRDFLLFQVQAGPRIYQKPLCTSRLLHEDPSYNYFKDFPDDQWVRTTDFTPSSRIGQSSAFCLELPYKCSLPDIGQYFVYYKKVDGPFNLEQGLPYSHGLDLVPIVQSRSVNVPYKILFKVNHMVQNGTLSGPTLEDYFFRMVDPRSWPINFIERALEDLSYSKSCCFNPVKWLDDRYSRFQNSGRPPKSTSISLDPGLVYVHRVQITPSKVYFYGPEINLSNRVLRNYPQDSDNFLRVSFVDEDCKKMRSTDLAPRNASEQHTDIYKRILSTLRNGIVVGEKKFHFLAFSSSQLRENSAWMFSSRNGLTAADIRDWMGDFRKIRNVAKYAARLGQSFSSSTETLSVCQDEVQIIDDIERAGYIFSDGIGKISPEFARKVAIKCNLKSSTPSAFQIRYGGYKGVVAVDPTSAVKLSLRKSMSKYESENTKLDVYSKNQPCFLNRQLINLLSTLGVKDYIFEMKQAKAVEQLDEMLTDPRKAEEALEIISPGETTNVLKEMLLCGYSPNAEPFLSTMMQTFRAAKLLELKKKTRIFVPKGRAMMGCLDETGTLEYGQIFVQVSCIGSRQFHNNGLFMFAGSESDHHTAVVKGKVVVAKNPCLHPGDVRILEAVDVPDLYHMVDCVVFPQKGKRPHPNECSGSDLDGDIYFVCWDPSLIPPRQVQPMEYTPAPTKILDHDVLIEEVEEYFTNYIVNDSLGIIANAHTVFADKEPSKAESPSCIELARLFSIAVDFPKTGVPAEIPPHLQVKEYPDFMEKLDKVTYESNGVIGKLFRAIKDFAPHSNHIKAFTREVAERSYDPDMEVYGFEDYVDAAFRFKGKYDFKLGNLMDHHGIKTEADILSGNIISKTFNMYKDGEADMHAIKTLRKEARAWFKAKSGNSGDGGDDLDAKASACYHVTYHPDFWGRYNVGLNRPHFLSFPWCMYDRLIQIKSKRVDARQADLSSLRCRLDASLRLS